MTWAVHHGDCFGESGLASLGPRSVDHIITDPMYDEHTHNASRRGCTGYVEPTRPGAVRAQMNRKRDLGFKPLTQAQMKGAAEQFARIARRWVLVFCSVDDMVYLWRRALRVAGLEPVRTGFWHKLGCTPQFTGDRPGNAMEAIVIAHQTRPTPSGKRKPMAKRWNGGGAHNVWPVPIVLDRGERGERRVHTTQKPLELMETLVRLFTNPGELICDPFAGSGTTLVAAKRLGRCAIGWENDEKYIPVARERLENTREQLDIETVVQLPDRRSQLSLEGLK